MATSLTGPRRGQQASRVHDAGKSWRRDTFNVIQRSNDVLAGDVIQRSDDVLAGDVIQRSNDVLAGDVASVVLWHP